MKRAHTNHLIWWALFLRYRKAKDLLVIVLSFLLALDSSFLKFFHFQKSTSLILRGYDSTVLILLILKYILNLRLGIIDIEMGLLYEI